MPNQVSIVPSTEERVAELTRRWEAGETTAAIGLAMGVSKNTIIGKVHRLGMELRCEANRSSPIPNPPKPGVEFPPPNHCQFPHGHPHVEGFHFCGAKNEPGYPYCPEHCARAYQEWKPGVKRPSTATVEMLTTMPKSRTHDGRLPTPMIDRGR